ncbi:hypothetical protein QA641_36115 [Bradyrhizobium sp. CB1650]|uniref:hypothetical protein n=1 Tax=Bradyrhizobium sp. CB1650 TaxID=3039153 RepID=UPI0024360893|nr:hypothetical protein [Bradyrhizobium sp. CB1650]WGD50952.1 hypothetical protein QA641_36115 [Bradyrhizobium sp. CB1650]
MFISIPEGCGNLVVGSRVDYVEELGEDGLQAMFGASWVRSCGALLMEIVREDDLLSARKSQSIRNGQGCGGAAMSPLRHEAANVAHAHMKSATPTELSFHRLSDQFDAVLQQEWRLLAHGGSTPSFRSHLHLRNAETLSRGLARLLIEPGGLGA